MTTTTLPPHPAAGQRHYQFFTDRDRVTAIPDLPDDAEATILLRLKTDPKKWYWVNQQPTMEDRLRVHRLLWWGWATSTVDNAISKLTPAGDAALGRYLESKASHGRGRKYDLLRRKHYPKPGEARPHPAAGKSEFTKHFTDRDRLETPPAVPDDAEGMVLLGFRCTKNFGYFNYIDQWEAPHNTREYRGATVERKITVMRCQWWDWLGGQDWKKAGPLTEAGNAALKAWLEVREAAGDAERADHRVRFFPTQADLDAQRQEAEAAERRKQAAKRLHNALHALHCSDVDLGHERHTITSRMTAIAMELGAGANNVDDLLAELRKLHLEKQEVERKVAENEAERKRIKQKGDA